MKGNGFTLIEMMISVIIMIAVSGLLFSIFQTATNGFRVQESKIIVRDEASIAMQFITRNLRQAERGSIGIVNEGLVSREGMSLTFRKVEDVDGNDFVIDSEFNVEFGPFVTYEPDLNDVNGDGRTDTQLVALNAADDSFIRVISNYIDTSRGAIFRFAAGGGVRVVLNLSRDAGATIAATVTRLEATVYPRN